MKKIRKKNIKKKKRKLNAEITVCLEERDTNLKENLDIKAREKHKKIVM